MTVDPIGVFHCRETHLQDAPRQAVLAEGNAGTVRLYAGRDFEQALRDLEGFSRIWLIFQFHQNETWKPVVQPPRADRKVGVFASRAPYRPNAIGLSCVNLVAVRGLEVHVVNHDLLDQTPILDIKPYVPYADSFPDAAIGWLGEAVGPEFAVVFGGAAKAQLDWLKDEGVPALEGFLREHLSFEPTNGAKKRVVARNDQMWEIAYRTWRATFRVDDASRVVNVITIDSAYSGAELEATDDRYGDKAAHRAFRARFGG